MSFDLLTTNIPGNSTKVELTVGNLQESDGKYKAKLRDVLVDLVIDYELLERDEHKEYHENTISALTAAIKDGRKSTFSISGTKVKNTLKIFPGEKNQEDVEKFLEKLVVRKDNINILVTFKHVTLRAYFTMGTNTSPSIGGNPTSAPSLPVISLAVTLNLPPLNAKSFLEADFLKLQEDSLSAIKDWHTQLYTHAHTNGVYMPK